MNTIELYLKMALFAEIERPNVERLVALGRERRLAAKDTLFLEDDDAASLFIVEEGRLAVRKRLGASLGPILSRPEPGTLIGEIPFFDHGERSATVMAIEPAVIREFTYETIEKFCRDHPEAGVPLMRNMGRILARRFRLLNEEIREEITWGIGS